MRQWCRQGPWKNQVPFWIGEDEESRQKCPLGSEGMDNHRTRLQEPPPSDQSCRSTRGGSLRKSWVLERARKFRGFRGKFGEMPTFRNFTEKIGSRKFTEILGFLGEKLMGILRKGNFPEIYLLRVFFWKLTGSLPKIRIETLYVCKYTK
jgi:hypothetical protein